ncbi:MAG: C40 family peptidase [Bacteroidetes bacterium]|nr:C40 family peptidase [Bacteroidota bacterium]MBS1738903.1 C40 family peptidase [Bacteroidota bacterium]MBS1776584.1 C40 family peptidase [Bacteroidota bacterium]
MVLSYGYCCVSIAAIRQRPAHQAEQVSQLLWGERVEILALNDEGWAKVRCAWDEYEGWCRVMQLIQISKAEFRKGAKYVSQGMKDFFVFPNVDLWVPLGSDIRKTNIVKGSDTGSFKGVKGRFSELKMDEKMIQFFALKFLHAPYLWGGRSVAGIDCSGFTQMVFKLCGKQLPRDAWQQATVGETIAFLQSGQCGDLAFFDNAEGKITHVGLLLSNDTIIHATGESGRVVIDKIDPAGIISIELRRRTHQLRLLKRYF